MRLKPPPGEKWTAADLEIGEPFLFKPKGATSTLGGVLRRRTYLPARVWLDIEQVRASAFSDAECRNESLFFEDEIEVVARYSGIEDLAKLREMIGS